MLLAEEPHAVIVAAGAEPVAPDLPGDGSVPVIAPCSVEDMARVPERAGAKLLLMDEDGYFWAAAIAEAAAAAAARAGAASWSRRASSSRSASCRWFRGSPPCARWTAPAPSSAHPWPRCGSKRVR
jgi:hypothetical protein